MSDFIWLSWESLQGDVEKAFLTLVSLDPVALAAPHPLHCLVLGPQLSDLGSHTCYLLITWPQPSSFPVPVTAILTPQLHWHIYSDRSLSSPAWASSQWHFFNKIDSNLVFLSLEATSFLIALPLPSLLPPPVSGGGLWTIQGLWPQGWHDRFCAETNLMWLSILHLFKRTSIFMWSMPILKCR